MYRVKSTARHEHIIIASSSSSHDDNNVSLGADYEKELTLTHDAASSSAIPQCRGDVPSQQDPYTRKCKVH